MIEYDSMREIFTYDGENYLLSGNTSKEIITDKMNKSKFMAIWDDIIAVSSIMRVSKWEISEIEKYIQWFDKEAKQILRDIVKERKDKWLKINWVSHLKRIAEDRKVLS